MLRLRNYLSRIPSGVVWVTVGALAFAIGTFIAPKPEPDVLVKEKIVEKVDEQEIERRVAAVKKELQEWYERQLEEHKDREITTVTIKKPDGTKITRKTDKDKGTIKSADKGGKVEVTTKEITVYKDRIVHVDRVVDREVKVTAPKNKWGASLGPGVSWDLKPYLGGAVDMRLGQSSFGLSLQGDTTGKIGLYLRKEF